MADNRASSPKGKAGLIAVVGAPTALLLLSLVGGFEGKRNDPYLDLVKVPTVCFGETRVAMRHYSDAECEDMLADGLGGFAKGVLERNPELRGHPYQLAAATSLSYNIGPSNYWRSTTARRFAAGRWREACDAMLAWNRAGGRVIAGLARRRVKERQVCLTGL
jgi:lysozyme